MRSRRRSLGLAWGWVLCLPAVALSEDWPQWLGPQRDSVWRETGIVERFPEGGLPVQWRVPIAGGYAGPAVADGRVFVTDFVRESGDAVNDPNSRSRVGGKERVLCFSTEQGRPLWTHEYPCDYEISYPAGPRATPTVDGDRVYTLGAEGDLKCLAVDSGKVIWEKDLEAEYDVEAPIWGFCAHPLVDGDKLICLVGGAGSVAVAFDKMTGRELWRSLSAQSAGYCAPIITEAGGVRQLIIWDPEAIHGLNPESGEVYWSVPLEPAYGMSIAVPRRAGDYLYASGIGDAALLLKLDPDKPAAEIVWRANGRSAVFCSNSPPLLADGMIYGCDCRGGQLRGADLETGDRLWETFRPTTGSRNAGHGTAFLVKHDDRYLLFSETGDLILAKLSRSGYEELGRFHVLEPTGEAFGRPVVWSHPAFANRCCYARNDKELVCVSLAAD